MGITDGSGDGTYRGVSVDMDTLAEWSAEFDRWEPLHVRNDDVGDGLPCGTGRGLPATATLRTAHDDAAFTAGEMVTIADRLWNSVARGVADAARVYARTDEDNARALAALRESLESAARPDGSAR